MQFSDAHVSYCDGLRITRRLRFLLPPYPLDAPSYIRTIHKKERKAYSSLWTGCNSLLISFQSTRSIISDPLSPSEKQLLFSHSLSGKLTEQYLRGGLPLSFILYDILETNLSRLSIIKAARRLTPVHIRIEIVLRISHLLAEKFVVAKDQARVSAEEGYSTEGGFPLA